MPNWNQKSTGTDLKTWSTISPARPFQAFSSGDWRRKICRRVSVCLHECEMVSPFLGYAPLKSPRHEKGSNEPCRRHALRMKKVWIISMLSGLPAWLHTEWPTLLVVMWRESLCKLFELASMYLVWFGTEIALCLMTWIWGTFSFRTTRIVFNIVTVHTRKSNHIFISLSYFESLSSNAPKWFGNFKPKLTARLAKNAFW